MHSSLTTVVENTTQDLTVLATVKAIMGLTTTEDDEALRIFIRQASAAIAKYCRRVFGKATVTETFRQADYADVLILSRYPVVSVASLSADGTAWTENTEYAVDKKGALVRRLSGDGEAKKIEANTVVITYDAGYSLLSTLPHDLEMACLSLVRSMISAARRDPLAKRIEIPDVRTIDYWVGGMGSNGALPPDVISLIEPYRDVRVR